MRVGTSYLKNIRRSWLLIFEQTLVIKSTRRRGAARFCSPLRWHGSFFYWSGLGASQIDKEDAWKAILCMLRPGSGCATQLCMFVPWPRPRCVPRSPAGRSFDIAAPASEKQPRVSIPTCSQRIIHAAKRLGNGKADLPADSLEILFVFPIILALNK